MRTETNKPAPCAVEPFVIPRPILRSSLTFNQHDRAATIEILICSHTDRDYPELSEAGWMMHSLDTFDVNFRIVS